MATAQTSQRKASLSEHLLDTAEAERIERLALALSDRAPPAIAKYLEQAAPAIGIVVAGFESAAPHVMKAYNMIHDLYEKLPKRVAMSIWGFCICFFGGRYAVSLAAYEAFLATGGKQMLNYMVELRREFKEVRDANAIDDLKDDDGDGIADVDQILPHELAMRKFKVFLATIDPERMEKALSGLWQGYMGVLVALRFQFAKTVALANSIADNMRPVAAKVLLPGLLQVTPEQYRGWIRIGMKLSVKTFAMIISWKIQSVISSVQSGISGGMIISQNLYMYLVEKQLLSAGLEDTMVDDAMGWSFAVAGIYYQLVKGGSLPFPLNLFMLPMSILEVILKWQVTWFTSETKALAQ